MSNPDLSPAEMIESCRGLVLKLAAETRKRYRLQIEIDELEAAGLEGLVQAQNAFEPGRGIAFTTFAYYRIRGAMLDNCRRLGLIKRRQKSQVLFEEAANEVLEQAARSAPPVVTQATTASWIAEAFDDMTVVFMMAEGKSPEPASRDRGPDQHAESSELKQRLRRHLSDLSVEERTIIEGYYLEGRQLTEVARELGVSKSWASRVHTRTLRKLKPLILGRTAPHDSS